MPGKRLLGFDALLVSLRTLALLFDQAALLLFGEAALAIVPARVVIASVVDTIADAPARIVLAAIGLATFAGEAFGFQGGLAYGLAATDSLFTTLGLLACKRLATLGLLLGVALLHAQTLLVVATDAFATGFVLPAFVLGAPEGIVAIRTAIPLGASFRLPALHARATFGVLPDALVVAPFGDVAPLDRLLVAPGLRHSFDSAVLGVDMGLAATLVLLLPAIVVVGILSGRNRRSGAQHQQAGDQDRVRG